MTNAGGMRSKRALADALAAVEADPHGPATAALLDEAFDAPRGVAVGLTGPPGVGKSTLIDRLIRGWRARGLTLGVIAIDPSSARTGGALLGDRTRFNTDPGDAGVFVRSMASRTRLGGIADLTFPAIVLMRAQFDLVLIETVGVGQTETAISDIADMTVFCAQPGSGDALQYMKAGVIEMPDLFLVTKADFGARAEQARADLSGALSLSGTDVSERPVILCSATSGSGIDAVLDWLETAREAGREGLDTARRCQRSDWLAHGLCVVAGTAGIHHARAAGFDTRPATFSTATTARERLLSTLGEAFEPRLTRN